MKRFALLFATVAGMALFAAPAQAHTHALGFIPQPNGDVTFFVGTYASGHATPTSTEGNLVITSGPSGVGTHAFTSFFNFTTAAALGLTAPGAFYSTNGNAGRPTVHFQSVTLSGLTAGSYTFDISGTTSATWFRSVSTGEFGFEWPFTATVTPSTSNPIPEPTSMALFGIGAFGFGVVRRRRRKAEPTADA